MNDRLGMRLALEEAQKARVKAPPNPWVGCALVKDGKLLAAGHSAPAGGPHAEINALQNVDAAGATLYVTLEPCAHHGRTPPCTDAIIKAGIERVVVGIVDPDPRVSGVGIEKLQDAGLDVAHGILEKTIRAQLAPYIKQRSTGRPFVLLKSAVSADGRSAASDGTSQWISSERARCHAHRLRAESGAIVVGSGTALKDRPKLTVRSAPLPPSQPLRVIVDRSGRCSQSDNTLTWEGGLPELLDELGKRQILQVLIEGGPTLAASFLKENLVDQLVLYQGSLILGDGGIPFLKDYPIATLNQAINLNLENTLVLDGTVINTYNFY